MIPDLSEIQLTPLLIGLFKGVVYRENEISTWQTLLAVQGRVRDYVALLGLDVILDEAEGYAYLRQRQNEDDTADAPRLVARRQLSYPVSVLLALLRKRLAEFDAHSGEERLIVDRAEIFELVRLFLPDATNEAKLFDRIVVSIERVVELGFLRRLRGTDDRYEVRRILKAFIDAQWLSDFGARLAQYREHGGGSGATEDSV